MGDTFFKSIMRDSEKYSPNTTGPYVRKNMESQAKILWGRVGFARISEIRGGIFGDVGPDRVARAAHWALPGAFDARRHGAKCARDEIE